jgi:hypothetical protein
MPKPTLVFTTALIVLVFTNLPLAQAELNVPLTIQEALPGEVVGIDRIDEPLTVGIPLPETSEV